MIFQTKKTKHVGRHFTLSDKDKQLNITAINKIIGQLETIKKDVQNDNSCDETLVQILAIKGGVASVGRNLVGKGILDCMGEYSREELELVIKNLFKLD
jgi:DNA-binding FrmR family transcriptional regulator